MESRFFVDKAPLHRGYLRNMVVNPHYKRKCSAAKNADHTLKRIRGGFSTESVLFL